MVAFGQEELMTCYSLVTLILYLPLAASCGEKQDTASEPAAEYEGDAPGECSDDADNDMDGLFDCDDPDCFGASVCEEADTDTDADGDSDTDADSDSDADADSDTDADTDTGLDHDADGDGYSIAEGDCDDENPDTHPEAIDVCFDGIDNDCDGSIDECEALVSAAHTTIVGESESEGLGATILGGMDLTGDGQGDLLVVAPGNDRGGTSSGAALICSSLAGGETTADDVHAVLTGADSDHLRGATGDVDLNGDGFVDLVFGAPYSNSAYSNAGVVYVQYGPVSTSGTLADADAILSGASETGYAGYSVASVGDQDLDGLDDFIVGAYGDDTGGTTAGAAYIVSGAPAGNSSLAVAHAVLVGESSDDKAGFRVANAGDVNGDGLGDIAVSAHDESSVDSHSGAVYVIHGPVSGSVDLAFAETKVTGEIQYHQMGRSLAAGGDLNGDGFTDLLIGGFGDDDGGESAGAVYVVLGPSTGTSSLATAYAKVVGTAAGDNLGEAASFVGDIDFDGQEDALIGAPQNDDNVDDGGAAYLFYSFEPGVHPANDAGVRFYGALENERVGYSVAGVGDIDNDGFIDVFVGATNADHVYESAGAAYLLLGNTM